MDATNWEVHAGFDFEYATREGTFNRVPNQITLVLIPVPPPQGSEVT